MPTYTFSQLLFAQLALLCPAKSSAGQQLNDFNLESYMRDLRDLQKLQQFTQSGAFPFTKVS